MIPNSFSNEGCGVEDPRLYELNGTYYSFFTGVHGPCGNGFDINEATSTDWNPLDISSDPSRRTTRTPPS